MSNMFLSLNFYEIDEGIKKKLEYGIFYLYFSLTYYF